MKRSGTVSWAALVGLSFIGCRQAMPSPSLDDVAETYVRLVLAVGEHDPGYVDAYYGPEERREAVREQGWNLVRIRHEAEQALADVGKASEAENGDAMGDDELVRLRQHFLLTQLRSLLARIDLLEGAEMSFDDESRALYDAVAPSYPEGHFQTILAEIGDLLPGDGPLAERYQSYEATFVIPADRLEAVFAAAIEECRERTRRHLDLPEGESFDVEYVTDRSWSAYNWYQGGFHSLIQVNTDLPLHIDRAIQLACHEGYPGHHVYNVLLEQHLVKGRGWVEYTVYPLFSPQSLIAEGSANYGIEVAFPDHERVAFERQVLFPLAGLDPALAETYDRIRGLVTKLDHAGNGVARDYLEGRIDRDSAARKLSELTLRSPKQAEQRLRFIDDYRSYIINYNLGQDLIRRSIESSLGVDASPDQRWQAFGRLLASPRLPSDL